MSEGRKPRQKGAGETDEALDGSADVQPESRVSEPQPAADEPSRQLMLIPLDLGGEPDATGESDATEELDESAELLVSVSSETLAWTGASSIEEGGAYAGELVEEGAEVHEADTYAREAPYAPADGSLLDQPGLEIRLARIHLRTGSLFMARAELEALAAREQLDTAAHLDLAEARWRTGDLHGAGEAAVAYLAGGGGAALGFVIAAEAFAMANRHTEAREHAELALERHLSELDPLFAGMPRRASWPARAWIPAAAEAERVEPPATTMPAVAPDEEPVAQAEEAAPAPAPAAETLPPAVLPVEEVAPVAALPVESPAVEPAAAAVAQAEDGAGAEVAAGRSFLESGDPMMAALHFGVAIRLAPASAAAVLAAIGDRQDLALQLVRGDALRLLGLEADAGNTYLSVASALGAGKPAAPEPPLEATAPAPEPPTPPLAEEPPAATEPPAPPLAEESSLATEPPAPPPAEEPPAAPAPPLTEEPPAATEPPPLRWE
jgi:tetratricopeptide (TPR) repeat protein